MQLLLQLLGLWMPAKAVGPTRKASCLWQEFFLRKRRDRSCLLASSFRKVIFKPCPAGRRPSAAAGGRRKRKAKRDGAEESPTFFCGPDGCRCHEGLQAFCTATEIKATRGRQVEKRGREGRKRLCCRAGSVTVCSLAVERGSGCFCCSLCLKPCCSHWAGDPGNSPNEVGLLLKAREEK